MVYISNDIIPAYSYLSIAKKLYAYWKAGSLVSRIEPLVDVVEVGFH